MSQFIDLFSYFYLYFSIFIFLFASCHSIVSIFFWVQKEWSIQTQRKMSELYDDRRDNYSLVTLYLS